MTFLAAADSAPSIIPGLETATRMGDVGVGLVILLILGAAGLVCWRIVIFPLITMAAEISRQHATITASNNEMAKALAGATADNKRIAEMHGQIAAAQSQTAEVFERVLARMGQMERGEMDKRG